MEVFFFQHVSLQFILELISPMQLLFLCCSAPSERCSSSTTQLSPSLSCTDQSAEKQAQKDRLQPQEAWQRKRAKMTHQRSQHTKGMPNKGQIYEFLTETDCKAIGPHVLSLSNLRELMILKNTSQDIPRTSPLSL